MVKAGKRKAKLLEARTPSLRLAAKKISQSEDGSSLIEDLLNEELPDLPACAAASAIILPPVPSVVDAVVVDTSSSKSTGDDEEEQRLMTSINCLITLDDMSWFESKGLQTVSDIIKKLIKHYQFIHAEGSTYGYYPVTDHLEKINSDFYQLNPGESKMCSFCLKKACNKNKCTLICKDCSSSFNINVLMCGGCAPYHFSRLFHSDKGKNCR